MHLVRLGRKISYASCKFLLFVGFFSIENDIVKSKPWETYFFITVLAITVNKRINIYSILPFLSGFCKSMKRDTDKVVMVYTVEITDAMTPKQWLHGQFENVNQR